jgi:hypothetical protein
MCIKNKQSLVIDLADEKSPFTCKNTLSIDLDRQTDRHIDRSIDR